MFREIPKEHYSTLMNAAGLPESDPMDPKIEKKYWEVKRCNDRIGSQLLPQDLAGIVADCGFGKPTKKENAPPSVIDLWKSGGIVADDIVEVEWLEGPRMAAIKRPRGKDEVIVQFIGDDAETPVSVDRVAVPQTAA
jgi:hypothetical protein